MPGKGCKERPHTPITTAKQARFFGAELGRREAGQKTKTGMSEATLRGHLRERGAKKR